MGIRIVPYADAAVPVRTGVRPGIIKANPVLREPEPVAGLEISIGKAVITGGW
jgi:hypothetical protein